jgi:hypothetical protein
VSFTTNVDNAGENPVYQWFLNNQRIENENGNTLSLSGLEDGDEVKVQIIADRDVWVAEESIFSNPITIDFTPLEPKITVAGNQLSTIEAASYKWYFNGELMPGDNRSITAENSGEYQVEVFNEAGCSYISESVNVLVCASEQPEIQIEGDRLTVTIAGSYTWYLNGIALAETTQSIIASQTGKYKVEVTDNQGCVRTSEEVDYQTTGLVDIRLLEGIRLYPNPATDVLSIESTMNEQLELKIMDVSGRLMYNTILLPESTHQLGLERFPEGLYILRVKSKQGVYQFKFIKQ